MTNESKKDVIIIVVVLFLAFIFFTVIVPFCLNKIEKEKKITIEQSTIEILIEKQYFVYDNKMYKIELVDELKIPEEDKEEL